MHANKKNYTHYLASISEIHKTKGSSPTPKGIYCIQNILDKMLQNFKINACYDVCSCLQFVDAFEADAAKGRLLYTLGHLVFLEACTHHGGAFLANV